MIIFVLLIGAALAVADRFTGRHLARMGTLRLMALLFLVLSVVAFWRP